jgi:hypothetical protein
MTDSTRFQFSLRTLFGVVTLCAVVMALVASFGPEMILGFSGLVWSGILVAGLAFALSPLSKVVSRLPYSTSFIIVPILYGGLGLVFFLFGEAIDQPHPMYADGSTWLTHGVSPEIIVVLVVGMLFAVAIDAVVQKDRPRDRVYFPQLLNIWHGLSSLHVRLILVIGGLIVVCCYADSVVAVWLAQQGSGGWVWPPKRVFQACSALWGVLWLADCASRPNRGTMAAAIAYLCMTLLSSPSGEVLRE